MDNDGESEQFIVDFEEMIKQLYAVKELKGYTETEIAPVKAHFGALPRVVEEFWRRVGRTEAIYPVQDMWIKPEDFQKWRWLMNQYLLTPSDRKILSCG